MTWETTHQVVVGDARDLALADGAVDLVVTSPPYPMIEMWDGVFAGLDPDVGAALDDGDGERAFRLMHDLLAEAWAEVARVLAPGGVACINVGDATRTLDSFRCYSNHAAVLESCTDLGLTPLPDVVWRKPANSAAKFMGSGMLPPNAYVTLEHEYVLVFRKGDLRRASGDRRRESAYFWEERNEWFSDVWEVRGERQALDSPARDRTAAYPFELPYRLVNMYSLQGDTVLDPFWGTGTTTLAAMASGRSSVGYELDGDLLGAFDDRVAGVERVARDRNAERLRTHRTFVDERRAAGENLAYENDVYGVPVTTRQERGLRLPGIESLRQEPADAMTSDRRYVVEHATFRPGEG